MQRTSQRESASDVPSKIPSEKMAASRARQANADRKTTSAAPGGENNDNGTYISADSAEKKNWQLTTSCTYQRDRDASLGVPRLEVKTPDTWAVNFQRSQRFNDAVLRHRCSSAIHACVSRTGGDCGLSSSSKVSSCICTVPSRTSVTASQAVGLRWRPFAGAIADT